MIFNYYFLLHILSILSIIKSRASGKLSTSAPNIVIFLADDLGYGDLSFSGHPTSRTPNIDQLASNGKFLTHYYVTSPVCSPSRASLLTGRYQVRSGTYPGVYNPDASVGLPHNETTIALLLKQEGYRTQIVGKWHLGVGMDREYLPSNPVYGFDNYLGIPYGQDMCPCNICFADNGTCSSMCWGKDYVSCPLFDNKEIVEQPVYLPDLTRKLVERATNFLNDVNKTSPFFLYFPFHQIHFPQFASSTFHNKNDRGQTGDSLLEMDDAVGKVVQTIKDLDLLEDTLIWFTSDNGPSLQQHIYGGCAGPLRCGKGTTWEGGVRVPSIVHWPSKISPGRSNALTSSLDILPTIANLVGVNISNLTLDGIDLSPLLFNEQVESPREFFAVYPTEPSEEIGPLAVIYKQFKAHFYTKGSERSDNDNFDPMCPAAHNLTKHDPPLLFDLFVDPGERYDLGSDGNYQDILDLISDWRDEHMNNMIWLPPRTRIVNDRSQPCCTNTNCDPFPGCCDCQPLLYYKMLMTGAYYNRAK